MVIFSDEDIPLIQSAAIIHFFKLIVLKKELSSQLSVCGCLHCLFGSSSPLELPKIRFDIWDSDVLQMSWNLTGLPK